MLPSSPATIPCNITIIGGYIEVETVALCNFVNYHAFMLSVFGPASLFFLLFTMFLLACNRCVPTDSVEQCCKAGLVCFFLSCGLESWLAFVYLALLILFMCVPLSRLVLSARFFRRNTAVAAVEDVALEEDVVVVLTIDPDTVCPICLESGPGRRWYMTKCCHQFHTDCIGQWKQRTCPMCRGITV